MTDDLMNAILAMNAYDFGPNASLDGTTYTYIGNWKINSFADPNNNNFMAVSYWDGLSYEISYRGTTDILGTDILDGDFWNGWMIGGGSQDAADVNSAITFYQSILTKVTANGGTSADITLTGHSLGGGLTGLVGSIYGVKGYLFDNMPFELAAANAYADSVGTAYNSDLAAFIYGTSTPTPNDESKLSAYATVGEALTFLRNTGGQSLPVTGLDSGATEELSSVQLHSMALETMLLYASDNNITDWSAIAPYFFPELWDDDVANAAGVGAYKTANGLASTALQEMIAYSALDEGTMLYGDVAIKSMFDDAGDLAGLVPANIADLSLDSNINGLMYQDLSQIAVQYSGQLAAEKSTDAALGLGVVHSGSNVFSVDLTPDKWSTGQTETPVAPNIVGARNAVIDAIMSVVGTPTPAESNQDGFTELFKGSGTALISGITEIKASATGGVTLDATDSALTYSGTAGGALLIGSPSGNTTFAGGGGTNIMVGQASDNFDVAVGNNIILEANGGTATLDSSTVSDTAGSTNWNLVEGKLDSPENFVFNSANLAPLTIVYGANGSDGFDFEAGTDKSVGVFLLQMNDINQTNFLSLDPEKINAYLDAHLMNPNNSGYGGQFDNKIVIINPTATDILKYNGEVINDPSKYVSMTDAGQSHYAAYNPNISGSVRRVDPNNHLKMVGDVNASTGIKAVFTDAIEKDNFTDQYYGLESAGNDVTLSAYNPSYDPDTEDYFAPQTRLTLSALTAEDDASDYDAESWDNKTGTVTTHYIVADGDLSLIGFNVGDFGINLANNSTQMEEQRHNELFSVSEWSTANVGTANGMPTIRGIEPASLGASLESSDETWQSPYNIVGDSSLLTNYRPTLAASDFMLAA
ncbi:hypothetical protein [Rhizobium leguminosarum]|uniref:Fungal lipase-like domain-containing protein n=1 Tax=Rhizobium leguminosarum TaxID=384 RepID=A0A1B1CKD5_RHILE|nr:hypothetical protein [Rhizobium leguminosarum]ANP90176.1 hypothetical protein BA011_40370 [Rhizobium leguminosarum]